MHKLPDYPRMRISVLNARLHSQMRRLFGLCAQADWENVTPLMKVRFVGCARPALSVGHWSHSAGVTLYCWDPKAKVEIGNYCSIAPDVALVAGGQHDIDWATTSPLIDWWEIAHHYDQLKPRFKGPITIGHDVWIGLRATVLSGVTIGIGAVIGAGSVVVKDVAPYAVVAGNPARIVKYRFEQEIIERLLTTRWWELDRKELTPYVGAIPRVLEFIKAVEGRNAHGDRT